MRLLLVMGLVCAAAMPAHAAPDDPAKKPPPKPKAPPARKPKTPDKATPQVPLERTRHAREIRSLIVDLGSAKFAEREAARARLLELGAECVPYLKRARDDTDAERRSAVRELINTLRWLVPKKLRAQVGDALDDFPALPVRDKLRGLGILKARPHEARDGIPFLITVARFDPSPRVRQAAVLVYLEVTPDGFAAQDRMALTALADETPSFQVSLLRAKLLRRLGKLEQALVASSDALKRIPNSGAAVDLQLDLLVETKRFKQAIPLALRAEKLAPNDLGVRIRAGEVLVRAGKPKEGLERLASAMKSMLGRKDLGTDPRLTPLLLRLGRAYQRVHKLADAVKVYRRALGQNPFNGQLSVGLADVYLAQGRVQDAVLRYLAEIRRTLPGGSRFNAIKARLQRVLREGHAGWLAQEDAFFRDAQRGRPVVAARLAVAEWLAGRGLYGQAIEELRAACALSPRDANARLLLGDTLRDAGRLPEARSAYLAARKLAPRSPKLAARLQDLATRTAKPPSGEQEQGSFRFWDQRLEGKALEGARAVGNGALPPEVFGDTVAVPVPGGIDVYGLAAKDGRFRWRFVPQLPKPEEGVSPTQLGLDPVALVPVAPGAVAAHDPKRARDPRPVLAILYDYYWRPAHRSFRVARFQGLLAYLVAPESGKLLARVELDRLGCVEPPCPVARRGRVLAYASPRPRRLELELIDLVARRPLWRAEVPASVRRPVFAGDRILVAWEGGVLALNDEGEVRWTHHRPKGAGTVSTGVAHVGSSAVFGTSDGKLVRLSLSDGSASAAGAPGKHRLTGEVASDGTHVFAAERGGAIHAVDAAGRTTWTLAGPKAAYRTLTWSGGVLFSLNGGTDYFAAEEPLLRAHDPADGRVVFQRPVARPARMVAEGGLVVVASGGVDVAGGLRVVGAWPKKRMSAQAARLAELKSAAADALAEGQFEVAAVVTRKFIRAVGGRKLLSDDNLAFVVRVLVRSRRPEEARDWLNYAEERSYLAKQKTKRWDALRGSLKLNEPTEGQ